MGISAAGSAGGAEAENWYGLQTRPRHEKIVAQRLEERGVTTFLPLVTEVHRWSDRKKSVQVPLFSCYVFAKFVPNRPDRLRVLRVDGVFGLVGARGEGTPIPDEQIDSGSESGGRATALVFSSLSQDRAASANPERSARRPGGHTRLPKRRPHPGHFRGCDPAIAGGSRGRIRSRTGLKLSSSRFLASLSVDKDPLTLDGKHNRNISLAGRKQGPGRSSPALVHCGIRLLAAGNCSQWLGRHGAGAIRSGTRPAIAGYSSRRRR